jgi:hypothetical protein
MQGITTIQGLLTNSGRFSLLCAPTSSPKYISGWYLHQFLLFLTIPIGHGHHIKIISPHCGQIHSALSTHSTCSLFSEVTKSSATAVPQWRGPSWCYCKQICTQIMDWCFAFRHPATNTFFQLLKIHMMGCPIHRAMCCIENSVFFRQFGDVPLPPPISSKSLHLLFACCST